MIFNIFDGEDTENATKNNEQGSFLLNDLLSGDKAGAVEYIIEMKLDEYSMLNVNASDFQSNSASISITDSAGVIGDSQRQTMIQDTIRFTMAEKQMNDVITDVNSSKPNAKISCRHSRNNP
eukprot:IDg11972t1